MSATGQLESSVTKHGIYTGRLAAGYNNDYAPIFNEMARDTRRLLAGDLTSFERARLTRVLAQLNTIIDGQLDLYDAQVLEDMTEFAGYEAGFATKMIQGVMAVELAATSQERIAHILSQTEMRLVSGKKIQQFTIQGMLANFRQAVKDKAASDIRQTIANGVAQGLSADRISRNVANGVSSSMSKGVIRQWSETNVRTAVAHVSQEAMNEAVRANADLIEWEKWSSTLDGSTSLICQGLDGTKFRVGEGKYPAIHFRCRSRRLPVIPEEYAIIKKSERASMFGPVDSRVTYGGWLKRQSEEFQNDVLGVERAKLFRSGKVSIKDFVDDQGRTLTLKELAAREGLTLE